jgi:hypothetical protein
MDLIAVYTILSIVNKGLFTVWIRHWGRHTKLEIDLDLKLPVISLIVEPQRKPN